MTVQCCARYTACKTATSESPKKFTRDSFIKPDVSGSYHGMHEGGALLLWVGPQTCLTGSQI